MDRMPGGVPLGLWPIICAAVSFSPSHIPWQYSGSCTRISAGAPPTGSSCSILLFEGIAGSRHKTYQSALCRFAVFSLCLTLFLLSQFLWHYVTSHFCTSHPRTYLVGIHFMQITLGLTEPREFSSLPRLHLIQAGIQRVYIYSRTLPLAAKIRLRSGRDYSAISPEL